MQTDNPIPSITPDIINSLPAETMREMIKLMFASLRTKSDADAYVPVGGGSENLPTVTQDGQGIRVSEEAQRYHPQRLHGQKKIQPDG